MRWVLDIVVGSAFEQLEDNHASNWDGANPELSDSFKFAEVSFTEGALLAIYAKDALT